MAGMTSGFTGIKEWKGNLSTDGPTVFVLPGAHYPAVLPGLALPLRTLVLAGWHAVVATWEMGDITAEEPQLIIDEATSAFEAEHGVPDLVLAKSIGTRGAGWAADHGIPAIWTTPLLTSESCVDALCRATAPAVLVAGTNDRCWDDEAAARTGLPTVRIEDASHGWQTGDWRRELAVLGELCEAVDAFAARLR